MADTIDVVAADPVERVPAAPGIDEQSVAERLVAQARKKGIELVSPDGLLSQLTKRFLETALEAEMSAISAMTSTTRSAATPVIPATECGPRRC